MKDHFVISNISLESWLNGIPSVDHARPAHCPGCKRASRPIGGDLRLHGHGTRERTLRGPLRPGARPLSIVLRLRRYLCTACDAVVTVVPRLVERGRRYTAAAIGIALALWGTTAASAREVRERVSPDEVQNKRGWASIRRWLLAVAKGDLFPAVRRLPADWPLRKLSENVAQTLGSLGPPTEASLLYRVADGVAYAGVQSSIGSR
jgi:hypothetical protein